MVILNRKGEHAKGILIVASVFVLSVEILIMTDEKKTDMMTLDIASSAWLSPYWSKGYTAPGLEKSFKKFYGRYQDLLEKYQCSVTEMVNNLFPGKS